MKKNNLLFLTLSISIVLLLGMVQVVSAQGNDSNKNDSGNFEDDFECSVDADCSQGFFCSENECEKLELNENNSEEENDSKEEFEEELEVELYGNQEQIQAKYKYKYKNEFGEEQEFECENCEFAKGELNQTRITAMLSNGRNAEIKVMPETASERALERLRLKNCNESNNCTIELKEVGVGNQTRMAYQVNARKEAKIFGLFKAEMQLETEIDAETGEVIRTNRPWWSFFSTEKDETEEMNASEEI